MWNRKEQIANEYSRNENLALGKVREKEILRTGHFMLLIGQIMPLQCIQKFPGTS
jgi:hypothetical protein